MVFNDGENQWVSEWVSIIPVLSWQEQVTIRWDDYNVGFVQDKQV
jgi:hypothetical protein